MIQLFINNHELLLPEDFEVTIIEENPEITKNGEFTLDMTLSLLEPQNAIAFGFLNRLNLTTIVKTAEARMIVDGKVSMGSAVMLSNTDVDVKFQFVAGNSELNYNAKADNRKIWELDWGTETAIDYARALGSINGSVENFVCTPVIIGDVMYNNYSINDKTLTIPSVITGVSNILMQPYLKYYIEKLPELMGYELLFNVLHLNARLNVMYLLNSVDSLKYGDALPDLTIAEFIDAIEEFFNVNFIVDSRSKTISIHNSTSSLATKKTVLISNVLESYTRDLSQDTKLARFGFTKIKYDFPGSVYFKYQELAPATLAKCRVDYFPTLNSVMTGIITYLDYHTEIPLDEKVIYQDNETGNEYFFGSTGALNLFTTKVRSLTEFICLINKFKPHGTDDTSILTLKIQPAEIKVMNMVVMWYLANGAEYKNHLAYQLPVCSNSYFASTEAGFVNTVEQGAKDIPRSNKLEVALFSGRIKMFNVNTWQLNSYINYPFSHTDFYPEFGCYENQSDRFERFESWRTTDFTPAATTTMRLTGDNGVVADYAPQASIDSTKEYIFIMPDSADIMAKNIFSINNSDYMPISLERVKSNKQKGNVKGTFYKML